MSIKNSLVTFWCRSSHRLFLKFWLVGISKVAQFPLSSLLKFKVCDLLICHPILLFADLNNRRISLCFFTLKLRWEVIWSRRTNNLNLNSVFTLKLLLIALNEIRLLRLGNRNWNWWSWQRTSARTVSVWMCLVASWMRRWNEIGIRL